MIMKYNYKIYIGGGIICIFIYWIFHNSHEREGLKKMENNEVNWKTIEIFFNPLPQEAIDRKEKIKVVHRTIEVMNIPVFYRESLLPMGINSEQSVLFLHGRRFTSENWENIGTLNILAALHYRAVAVDLPGYGQTTNMFEGKHSDFIFQLIQKLGLIKPVLVSPSMSGEYSIRFLAEYSRHISGFVPVAPVGTGRISRDDYHQIKVPTLIVFGSNDKTGLDKESLENLSYLPNSRQIRIEKANHAAYLDEPEVFHKMLFNFLLLLG